MTSFPNLNDAFAAFDQANQQDPNLETVNDQPHPKEWLYGQRMSQCLQKFCPEASAALQLAARSQHIQRWKIARTDYPEGRQGYKKWRSDLAGFHADTAGALLSDLHFDNATIARVKDLLQKKQLKRDPEAQALEDVICLVFLEHYLADFAAKHSEEKLLGIIRKTWKKMSAEGHQAALNLPLEPAMLTLVQKALS